MDYQLLIAQGVKGSSTYKQRNNMGEIRKHRDALSQCRDSLALQRNEICVAVETPVPGVVIFEHNLAYIKLELVKSAQSCCSRSQVSSSSIPFPVAGNVWTRSACDNVEMCLTSNGIPAA